MSSIIFDLLFNNKYNNIDNLYYNPLLSYDKDNENSNNSNNKLPVIDINESYDYYIIEIELPGICKNQIKVSIKNYILFLSVDKNSTSSDEKIIKNLVSERKFGILKRRINLIQVKDKINLNSITSSFINGLLIIKIKKTNL